VNDTTAMGPGREFDAIRALVRRWGPRAKGIGSDAAVLQIADGERVVVSTDVSVEGVHFRSEWMTPEEIGWRATMAALSDLAAAAARPIGVLAALTVPPLWRDALVGLGEGIGAAAETAEAPIIGGDMSDGVSLSLAMTVMGRAMHPLTRDGAHDGDALWVTGTLGGPALAFRAWSGGAQPVQAARERFVHPRARIREAEWLRAHGAHAAIDISDGLVADARHLAAANSARITIALDDVPAFEGCDAAEAAAGGEEYELLVTAPTSLDARAFVDTFTLPLTRVGTLSRAADATVGVTVTRAGERVEITGGYDHFSP
jgi:thiamine-monophosphate kinase